MAINPPLFSWSDRSIRSDSAQSASELQFSSGRSRPSQIDFRQDDRSTHTAASETNSNYSITNQTNGTPPPHVPLAPWVHLNAKPNEDTSLLHNGSLVVRVLTGSGTLAVPRAMVTVTDDRGNVASVTYTDKSGITDNILLPAKIPYEDTNDNVISGAYMIEIDHEGYESVVRYNVPIFPDTKSLQIVNLMPKLDLEGFPIAGAHGTRHENGKTDIDSIWGDPSVYTGADTVDDAYAADSYAADSYAEDI